MIQIKSDDRFLYCDEYLAVVNKSIGEICENDTAVAPDSLGTHILAELKDKTEYSFSYASAVNRLDRPVSGCVLIAFSKDIAAELSDLFKNHSAVKKYWAVIEHPENGISAEAAAYGTLRHHLVYNGQKRKSFIAPLDAAHPVNAVLEWKRIGSGISYGFVEVVLKTGKTHQIRAQLSAVGNPVKGDIKYGARRNEKNGGIRLHSRFLEFTHPITGARISVTAPLPYQDPLWQAFSDAAEAAKGK